MQRLVPAPLEVDTFDDRAWVSLTPFVTTFDAFGAIPLPGPRTFPETNVRTYVRAPDGTDGVWFLSLDVANLANVIVGRLGFPYNWSRMQVTQEHAMTWYSAVRRLPRTPDAAYAIRVECGDVCDQNELDVFLTGRWHTYTKRGPGIARFDIEHATWPLHRAVCIIEHEGFIAAAGLDRPIEPPIVHYSPGVDVAISYPATVKPRLAHLAAAAF